LLSALSSQQVAVGRESEAHPAFSSGVQGGPSSSTVHCRGHGHFARAPGLHLDAACRGRGFSHALALYQSALCRTNSQRGETFSAAPGEGMMRKAGCASLSRPTGYGLCFLGTGWKACATDLKNFSRQRIFFPRRLLLPFPLAFLQTVKNNDSLFYQVLSHVHWVILK